MAQFQSKAPGPNRTIVNFKEFRIRRDIKFAGYKVELKWEEKTNPSILGFNVYKAILKKPLLTRDYVITQLALEKLAAIKAYPPGQNTVLFNKSFFSQNSKVKFYESNSDRFDKKEGNVEEIDFFNVKFVRKTPFGVYNFTDSDVRFGETYAYVLSSVNDFAVESPKSIPIFANVEDLEHPSPPFVEISRFGPAGILLQIHSEGNEDVCAFDVFGRSKKDADFVRLARIRTHDGNANFFKSFLPPDDYEFVVYSVDFFGNLSFAGTKRSIFINGSHLVGSRCYPKPDIKLSGQNEFVAIEATKNHPDLLGVRIERQDSWRFEKGFQIKEKNQIPWPNVIVFDKDGKAKLVDEGTDLGRKYRYRASTILKSGIVGSTFVTPLLVADADLGYSSVDPSERKQQQTAAIRKFDLQVLDSKQRPLFTKFKWEIEGNWNYIQIKANEQTFRIDDVHTEEAVFTDFLPGNSYDITFSVFDEDGNLQDQQSASLTT